MSNFGLDHILGFIYSTSSRDLSCYSLPFLDKIIRQRIIETNSTDSEGYLAYLTRHHSETERLLHSLNISYSLFFRDPLDYAIIQSYIIPELCQRKGVGNGTIRLWSAACADGQEPYSLAIIAEDFMKKINKECRYSVLATDISPKILSQAEKGVYGCHSVQNISYAQLKAYFTQGKDTFTIHDKIKERVEFILYDLLDEHTMAPPSAIFCGFDMVVCSNILIYYNAAVQHKILNKLHHALTSDGFLMVDPSEKEIVRSFPGFRQYSHLGNIFVKK